MEDWSDEQLQVLRDRYPNEASGNLEWVLMKSIWTIIAKAKELGLEKVVKCKVKKEKVVKPPIIKPIKEQRIFSTNCYGVINLYLNNKRIANKTYNSVKNRHKIIADWMTEYESMEGMSIGIMPEIKTLLEKSILKQSA